MKIKQLTLMTGLGIAIAIAPSCNKEKGCTDSAATNYNSEAEEDDGSCTYTNTTDTTTTNTTSTGGTNTTGTNSGGTTDTTNTGGTTTVTTTVSSSVKVNTWKTYDIFALQEVSLIDNFFNPGTDLTLKLKYTGPGNSVSGNIDLTFKGNEIKPGVYKITDKTPNDDEVKFSGSLSAALGSSTKSVWLFEEEKQTKKIGVEKLSNGDYLVTMSPTKVQQVSGSSPYKDVIETKVQFNLSKNTYNGRTSDGTKFQRYVSGGGKVSSEIALTSGIGGATNIKLIFTGIDFWAGDIASQSVTLETNDNNVLAVDGVYVSGNMQPKAGSSITYKVENGVFTGTMSNIVLTDGTKEETVSAKFYVIL